MKIKRSVDATITPFKIPDKVFPSVQLEGSAKAVFQELTLDKMDTETLHKLRDEFKENVFKSPWEGTKMKLLVEVDLKPTPFRIPKSVYFVAHERGSKNTVYPICKEVPLAEIDVETLYKLCDEFKQNVFKAAGRGLCNI